MPVLCGRRRPDAHPEQERYLNIVRQTEGTVATDPEIVVLLDILFGDGDSLRLFYKAS